jgi:hypothetical protein
VRTGRPRRKRATPSPDAAGRRAETSSDESPRVRGGAPRRVIGLAAGATRLPAHEFPQASGGGAGRTREEKRQRPRKRLRWHGGGSSSSSSSSSSNSSSSNIAQLRTAVSCLPSLVCRLMSAVCLLRPSTTWPAGERRAPIEHGAGWFGRSGWVGWCSMVQHKLCSRGASRN